MFYRVHFDCRDDEPLQRLLNDLYEYGEDLETKVLHRCRLNLFFFLMEHLLKCDQITSCGSAIDIGCNSGIYSRMLSDFGFRYVLGIDVVENMIHKATETFGCSEAGHIVEFRLQNAEDIDTSSKFDFIICTEVIEHTDHPESVIANIKALLAPGGIAVISLPNKLSPPYLILWAYHKLTQRRIDDGLARHFNYPFYRTIRLFQEGDIRIISTDGANLFWFQNLLNVLYRTPAFPILNRMNFRLARLWPFKCLSQFFFVVVRKM